MINVMLLKSLRVMATNRQILKLSQARISEPTTDYSCSAAGNQIQLNQIKRLAHNRNSFARPPTSDQTKCPPEQCFGGHLYRVARRQLFRR